MTTLTPGLRWGQYTLEGHLSEGGMGTVFRAFRHEVKPARGDQFTGLKFISNASRLVVLAVPYH